MDAEALARLLTSYTYSHTTEAELQQAIEQILTAHSVVHERELVLPDTAGRIDFAVASDTGWIGVEVKIGGGAGDVERQLRRYVDSGEFEQVVLVTTRARQALIVAGDALDGVQVVVLR